MQIKPRAKTQPAVEVTDRIARHGNRKEVTAEIDKANS